MPQTSSIKRLHLSCRIWIAEMNLDINILRIFDDYLHELSVKKNELEIKTGIDYFEKQFVANRKEIDELRHEMHILKMDLGAYSRESKLLGAITSFSDNHSEIGKRYLIFRKNFSELKNEFTDFEGKWLD